ncbi:NACHT, LRR and PYD domains-containing protein 3-like [Pseudophryne corroboree]|uniref:NACHT, LRR and PYD domains-containing protein 3-like n=1 Tax=Pseudophryne corroboree TaxID=495146 RepID=UPI0030820D37
MQVEETCLTIRTDESPCQDKGAISRSRSAHFLYLCNALGKRSHGPIYSIYSQEKTFKSGAPKTLYTAAVQYITYRGCTGINILNVNVSDFAKESFVEVFQLNEILSGNCVINVSVLGSCDLTSSCCDDLRSAVTTNRSLTRLVLSQNNLPEYIWPPLQHLGGFWQEESLMFVGYLNDTEWAQCERNKTHGDILYEALEDLTQNDFKRFKDKLSDFSDGERGPIPRGRLETAGYVTTKNVLTDVYGEDAALDVTIQVFKLINLIGPAEALQHQVTQHDKAQKMSSIVTLEGYRSRYMDQMRKKYHVIKHHDKRLGKGLNLKKEYTSLLLIKNYQDEREKQIDIMFSSLRYLQIMEDRSSDKYSTTTIQTLFDPDDDGTVPNTVVLQGPAGIGKTITSQKIMLDWASGELYKDKFQFVFYISCREVNTITGNISLAGYLSSYFGRTCPSDLLKSIFHNSEEILFIVDGLDELKWSSMNDTEVCDDPFQEVSKEILLKSLIKKTLLSDSSLIITTRPFSLMKLMEFVKCIRYVEILGFTGKDCEEYF